MSASFNTYVSSLFGLEEQADCMVVFYCCAKPCSGSRQGSKPAQDGRTADGAPPVDADQPADQAEGEQSAAEIGQPGAPAEENAKRRKLEEAQTTPLPTGSMLVGEPLPAHKLVLCGGSPLLRGQVDRWVQDHGYGVKPVLHVPLGEPADLSHALAAVRFMYTGKLLVSDAPSLLRVRRQAANLQVEGCTEACERALLKLVTSATSLSSTASAVAVTSGEEHHPAAAGALAGVVQLYNCRELISNADVDPAAVHKLLRTCRQQLVKHISSVDGQQQQLAPMAAAGSGSGPGVQQQPGLGELLAWAFGDAPSLLSNPKIRKQMESLPPAAMEALLGCDSFATDNEATVLLALLRWLATNEAVAAAAAVAAINDETRQRLLRLIRLSQLSDTYLLRLLPLLLSGRGISPPELRFLQEYAAAPSIKRAHMKEVAGGFYDFKSPWYVAVPRAAPRLKGGGIAARSYDWYVDDAELRLGLELQSTQPEVLHLRGRFANGASCVVSNGFEWYPEVCYHRGKDVAGVFLYCVMPGWLDVSWSAEAAASVHPGPCRLAVYKWTGGGGAAAAASGGASGGGDDGAAAAGGSGRDVAWSKVYVAADFCRVGWGRGEHSALPLVAPAAAAVAAAVAAAATAAGGAEQDVEAAAAGADATAAAGATPLPLLLPAADLHLARWAPYLKDGKLWGSLSWEPK